MSPFVRRAPVPRAGAAVSVRGVTLIELLIVLVIVSLLLGLGTPQWAAFIERQGLVEQAESFRASLRLAREQAMRRGEVVTVCALDTASSAADARCLSGPRDWTGGWLVFVDRGSRGERGAGDPLLQVHQVLRSDLRLQASVADLSFHPNGLSLNAASHVEMTGQSSGVRMRLCVSKTGKVRSTEAVACA